MKIEIKIVIFKRCPVKKLSYDDVTIQLYSMHYFCE